MQATSLLFTPTNTKQTQNQPASHSSNPNQAPFAVNPQPSSLPSFRSNGPGIFDCQSTISDLSWNDPGRSATSAIGEKQQGGSFLGNPHEAFQSIFSNNKTNGDCRSQVSILNGQSPKRENPFSSNQQQTTSNQKAPFWQQTVSKQQPSNQTSGGLFSSLSPKIETLPQKSQNPITTFNPFGAINQEINKVQYEGWNYSFSKNGHPPHQSPSSTSGPSSSNGSLGNILNLFKEPATPSFLLKTQQKPDFLENSQSYGAIIEAAMKKAEPSQLNPPLGNRQTQRFKPFPSLNSKIGDKSFVNCITATNQFKGYSKEELRMIFLTTGGQQIPINEANDIRHEGFTGPIISPHIYSANSLSPSFSSGFQGGNSIPVEQKDLSNNMIFCSNSNHEGENTQYQQNSLFSGSQNLDISMQQGHSQLYQSFLFQSNNASNPSLYLLDDINSLISHINSHQNFNHDLFSVMIDEKEEKEFEELNQQQYRPVETCRIFKPHENTNNGIIRLSYEEERSRSFFSYQQQISFRKRAEDRGGSFCLTINPPKQIAQQQPKKRLTQAERKREELLASLPLIGNFDIYPSLDRLRTYTIESLACVKHFEIWNNHGTIRFEEPVSMVKVDLGKCIKIVQDCIEINDRVLEAKKYTLIFKNLGSYLSKNILKREKIAKRVDPWLEDRGLRKVYFDEERGDLMATNK